MSAGTIQLISQSIGDIYLTKNPEITFFKSVYRRHTNFAIDTKLNNFDTIPNFNRKINCKIQKIGDLMSNLYLRIILPRVNPNGGYFAWVKYIGYAIIRNISIEMGGYKIDSQCGEYMYIWHQLSRNYSQDISYNNLLGNIGELIKYNDKVKPEYILDIPLSFWFCRIIGFYGSAIPLISTQYSDINISVEIEDINKLIIYSTNLENTGFMDGIKLVDGYMLVDYVYLDRKERIRFSQMAHEYLVEQVQSVQNRFTFNVDATLEKNINLDLNYSVKELLWITKFDKYMSNRPFIYYTHKKKWNKNKILKASSLILDNSIVFRNDPSDIVGGKWYKVDAMANKYIGGFYIKNMIDMPVYFNPTSLKIGEYGITSKITSDIIILYEGEDNVPSIIYNNLKSNITIEDLSIPVDVMEDTRYEPNDVVLNMFGNYGIYIDGTNNPIESVNLKLNGMERFGVKDSDYFNYIQPEYHHSNIPNDGVNVYSFGIFPEEFQPTGSCDFSMIDKSNMVIKIGEDVVKNIYNIIGNNNITLMNLTNCYINIYAINYNIQRYVGGYTALAF